MCWLYSMKNFPVFQQLDTLYLGGNYVRVVCERMWRKFKLCAFKRVLQLDLATDSWLASRQSATRVKHARSWRVTIVGELQDEKYSLAKQLARDSNLRLIPLARLNRQNALLCRKMTFHIPHVLYYKYLYTHEMLRASRENFERETL